MKVEQRIKILGIPIPFAKEVVRTSKILKYEERKYDDGSSLSRATEWLEVKPTGEVELIHVPLTGLSLMTDIRVKGTAQPIRTPEELNEMNLHTRGRIKKTFFKGKSH